MTHFIRSCTVTGCFALAGILSVQKSGAQQFGARCDIPFAFEIGSEHLEAGHYTILTGWNGLVTFRGEKRSTFQLPIVDDDGTTATSDKLVFTRVGADYYLRDMRVSNQKSYLHWPVSKAQHRQQMLVRQDTAPSTTTVALVRAQR